MPPPGHPLRPRAIGLYKELSRLGREYPDPSFNFHAKLRAVSAKNANLTKNEDVEKLLNLGDYIRKEIETLYFLRRYRWLRRQYYADVDDPSLLQLELEEKMNAQAARKQQQA